MMGSHVTEFLVWAGARVLVADNLSRGSQKLIESV